MPIGGNPAGSNELIACGSPQATTRARIRPQAGLDLAPAAPEAKSRRSSLTPSIPPQITGAMFHTVCVGPEANSARGRWGRRWSPISEASEAMLIMRADRRRRRPPKGAIRLRDPQRRCGWRANRRGLLLPQMSCRTPSGCNPARVARPCGIRRCRFPLG